MQFSELRTTVLAQAFPLGPPENLMPQLKDFFVEALIEIQRWVNCYQFGHADIFPACSTYWHCGSSVIQAPRGKIYRAYTVARGKESGEFEWCCPVSLNPADMAAIRQFQARMQNDWRQQFFITRPDSGAALPLGFDVPNVTSDNVGGRAFSGLYALDKLNGRLVVVPWLQSYEALVVEWNGMKRVFSDFDEVPDDPDFVRLVRMWVLLQYGMFWGCEDLALRQKNWDDALADAIVTCNSDRQLHGSPASAEERETSFGQYCAKVEFAPETVTEADEIDIVLFGSWGTGDDNAKGVAASIAGNFPSGSKVWIQTTGDNVFGQNDPATIFSAYSDYIDVDKFAIALGEGDLQPENQFAQIPGQPTGPEGHQRWYERVIGPVSFFVFNGTTGKEPSGTWVGSAQHRAMTAAITRSTSRWKVAVIHQDPVTSGEAQAPGMQGLSWISDLGVHAVVSGNSKNYERIRSSGRWHFVVGTGGETPLEGFVTPPVEGSAIQIEALGYLVFTATCDTLCWKFYGGAGFGVLDEGCIDVTDTPEPPGPPLGFYRIYTGRADFPTLDSDGIKNLIKHDIRQLPLLVNTGDAVAPGYYFVAVDNRLEIGATGSAKPAFMVGQFEVAMAFPGSPDPFGTVGELYNGYYYESRTVDGLPMRLFRFHNETAGSISLTIQQGAL